ncbi:hypothetical protein K438DRAFT_1975719 [Mycena galopus ATCC 62051]|nr:hypothetical protein K438DRAFT_1975719 [Mycena galopus ATCC 62051]
MHIHQPHIGEVVSVSANGCTAATHTHVVSSEPSVPEYFQEDVITNAALEDFDFSYDLGDTALLGETQEPETDGIQMKRKVYQNSDFPMLTWAEHQDEYLDEMLRLEGRGYAAEWNGSFCERRALKDLGLVIQLGHPIGFGCPNPPEANKNFTVIDTTGVHNVAVNFCACDGRVERRQQLMRVCWWPATDCRRAFRHIVRQYRMTLMMKRAGRGHDPSGVKGTAQGQLALQCRMCPQDGKNLPDGWDKIDWDKMPKDLRYKYFLFLAQDCNFRLINRNVGSAAKDPIVGDGLGYFVNHARYTEYLRKHVSEEEISSCSGFQAMFLANKKRIKGLRTTGVGGVTCARHNMWRPNGIGDLQLGERRCNVDFILFSAILNIIILYIILSYDIACQYLKNFWMQMETLLSDMQLLIDCENVWFKIPNFHLPAHKPWDHSPFSFYFMWGAGTTHGETVEQNWEFTNRAAASTKMMGIGTRHATLEDLFGFHNWRRTVAWRQIFTRRMATNVKEGQTHRDAFEAFNEALTAQAPELVTKWVWAVHDWEARQHKDGTESPFELKEEQGMTIREICLKLEKEELLRNGSGEEIEREDMPSTQLLAIDVKALQNPTERQSLDFVKRRTALTKCLHNFRKLQWTYMPNLRWHLTAVQCVLWDAEADCDVETVRLFMLSDIQDTVERDKACAAGLSDIEAELRVREAREALHTLRHGLHARTLTNWFRLRNCRGQQMLTRGLGVLRQINLKVHKAKLRYRYARNALLRVRGHGTWERELQVLDNSDVRALNERALTTEEAEQRKVFAKAQDNFYLPPKGRHYLLSMAVIYYLVCAVA